MSVEVLLSRLQKVKRTTKDSWRACCPAHGGTKQSLAIRDDNGKVLVHCFAEGCAIGDIFGAVGLNFNDVMPKALSEHKAQKKPFYASDILEIAKDEILIANMICKKILDGTVNFNDMQRLKTCQARLSHAEYQANGDNGLSSFERRRIVKISERVLDEQESASV